MTLPNLPDDQVDQLAATIQAIFDQPHRVRYPGDVTHALCCLHHSRACADADPCCVACPDHQGASQ